MRPEVMARVFDLDFPIELLGGDRVGVYYRAVRRDPAELRTAQHAGADTP